MVPQVGQAARVWSALKSPENPHPISILLVEPDNAVRRSLVNWLRGAIAEYTILEAATKEQAAIVAQSESPSVIVVDLACPGVDGKEIVRDVKCAAPWATVVALTMCDDTAYRECLASAGAAGSLLIWNTYSDLLPLLRTLNTEESEHQEQDTAEE